MGQPWRALIIAKPGRVRDGLQALLTAIPEIGSVEQTDDVVSALRMIAEQQPELVLLEFSLTGEELQTILEEIEVNSPQTQCLVLADNALQQQEAQACCADGVLIKGFTAQRLIRTVRGLLPEQGSLGR